MAPSYTWLCQRGNGMNDGLRMADIAPWLFQDVSPKEQLRSRIVLQRWQTILEMIRTVEMDNPPARRGSEGWGIRSNYCVVGKRRVSVSAVHDVGGGFLRLRSIHQGALTLSMSRPRAYVRPGSIEIT